MTNPVHGRFAGSTVLVHPRDRDVDEVHVGYIEGWFANWGSPLVARTVGDGTVYSCTFPIGERYGDHPVATVL